MNTRLLLTTLAAALVAVTASSPAMARPDAGSTLTVRSSAWGRIVFDTKGRALYAFTADRAGRSACSGACAAAWPPYLLRGSLSAGPGTKRNLLGTIRRADGSRQVTYAGKPLYYYVGDRNPGQVLCQNVREFGGLWLVVRPTGALVRGG
jgi:predicted lipoprotein with Yx(FWY)xxD motif